MPCKDIEYCKSIMSVDPSQPIYRGQGKYYPAYCDSYCNHYQEVTPEPRHTPDMVIEQLDDMWEVVQGIGAIREPIAEELKQKVTWLEGKLREMSEQKHKQVRRGDYI